MAINRRVASPGAFLLMRSVFTLQIKKSETYLITKTSSVVLCFLPMVLDDKLN
jgi:hypothetical protein